MLDFPPKARITLPIPNGMNIKVGCIIQGDIRRGTKLVLSELPKLFDYTVFSTWDDANISPSSNFEVVRSSPPPVPGFTHRNYQRLSTARGLQAAKTAGCDYVLKWRSDMLPTRITIKQLLLWANFQPPPNAKSRIVLPAFRNISIDPDTFSTIPDLFAFGHIDEMIRLWGDAEFNYSQMINMSIADKEHTSKFQDSPLLPDLYCAEAELYALYRSKLEESANTVLNHKFVVENHLHLIDHRDLGILWFDKLNGFRSIGQAWEHPWWTVGNWRKRNAKVYPCGYQSKGLIAKFKRKLSKYKITSELKMQEDIWSANYPTATP